MMIRVVSSLVGFDVAYENALAKLVEVIVARRNSHNGRQELKRLAACLEKVEAALMAQTSILTLMHQRQADTKERMNEVSKSLADGLARIERKIA